MTLGLIAKKMGMIQIFKEGVMVPVTVMRVGLNRIIDKCSQDVRGYNAFQIGHGSVKGKALNRCQNGYFLSKGIDSPVRYLREFQVGEGDLVKYNIGDFIGVDFFRDVLSVDVSSVSKGKGFAGVMKRHNFSGFPRTHGTHEYFRHGGSIGMRAKPGRVFKGKKMPGQMGNERVTTSNLRVVGLLEDKEILFVRGAVPGAKGSIVEIRPSYRKAHALINLSGIQARDVSKNPMKASKASVSKGKGKAGGKK